MSTVNSSYSQTSAKTDWNVSDDEDENEDVDFKLNELICEGDCQHATDGQTVTKKIKEKVKELFEKLPVKQSTGNPNAHVSWEDFYGPDSEDEYENKGGKRLMVVIQNETFYESHKRIGCTADRKALKKTFKNLGFRVKCFKNLEARQIGKTLQEASKDFIHGEADCFACVILSHGGEFYTNAHERKNMIYGVDESRISVERIMNYFDSQNCPALQGKPRLFFVQACRGKDSDAGENIQLLGKNTSQRETIKEKTQVDAVPSISSEAINDQEISISDSQPILPIAIEEDGRQGRTSGTGPVPEDMDNQLIIMPSPCYTDSLIMFSSPPGHVSYTMTSGSWFIQSLCAEFNNYSNNKPFVHYLTNTCRRIALDFKSLDKEHAKYDDKVVVPCIYSSLTKDLKLV
ncbi:caspase-3 [Patella vulgata]|uniref:caspase-3 n=1 Tax=Patella vulgata TaxID=6465 RepID=UPI0024A9C403|nr:caspase-3 [Patella vulgata]